MAPTLVEEASAPPVRSPFLASRTIEMLLLALVAILSGAATSLLLSMAGYGWLLAAFGFALGGSVAALLAGMILSTTRQDRSRAARPALMPEPEPSRSAHPNP
ncbi:hypothetical protein [Methylobacterium sp. ID0610]|uniref:hypothetical protein n=1 Tax=Methylobacterium carpenticola TaxID=3344827 RepID=UPI0036B347D0